LAVKYLANRPYYRIGKKNFDLAADLAEKTSANWTEFAEKTSAF